MTHMKRLALLSLVVFGLAGGLVLIGKPRQPRPSAPLMVPADLDAYLS
jgi:hypothetical protein